MNAQQVLSTNEEAARQAVEAGVRVLDEHAPTWWMHIDRSTLDINSEQDCILAQLQQAHDRAPVFNPEIEPEGGFRLTFMTPCETALYRLVSHPTGDWSWDELHGTMVQHGWWPNGELHNATLLTQLWLMEVTRRMEQLGR